MFVTQKDLNGLHLATEFCRRGMERKWSRLAGEELWVGTERELTSYRDPLSHSTSFKYLRRVLAAEEYNLLEVVCNLRCARQKWAWLTLILSSEGVDAHTLGNICLAVVQSILLYGSKTWDLMPRMKRALRGFHRRVAHRLTG